MNNCTVQFICNEDQKIILPFTLHENGELEYKILSEPPITDPKLDLGLGGLLLEKFLFALQGNPDTNNEEVTNEN